MEGGGGRSSEAEEVEGGEGVHLQGKDSSSSSSSSRSSSSSSSSSSISSCQFISNSVGCHVTLSPDAYSPAIIGSTFERNVKIGNAWCMTCDKCIVMCAMCTM